MDELRIPRENANDDVVLVTRLHVSGEVSVTAGQDLIEIETSKTSVVLEAPRDGLLRVMVNEGDEVSIDDLYAVYLDGSHSAKQGEAEIQASNGSVREVSPAENQVLSNNAVELLESAGARSAEVSGYWITSRSLKGQSPIKKTNPATKTARPSEDVAGAKVTSELPHTRVKISIRKRSEIRSLSVTGGGAFQSCLGIDVRGHSRRVPDFVFGSSIQDLVCYETGKLLAGSFKEMNAFYAGDDEIGLYDEVHAGISLDDGARLTVARIPDVSGLTLTALRSQLVGIYNRFEDNALTSEDLKPSTFTISDLSGTRCGYVLPLINDAQALIIGIVRNATGFTLFVSFDHRVTEGFRIAEFSESLRDRLELHFREARRQDLACSLCEKSLQEEQALDNRGFIQIATGDGNELICRNCFDGW